MSVAVLPTAKKFGKVTQIEPLHPTERLNIDLFNSQYGGRPPS